MWIRRPIWTSLVIGLAAVALASCSRVWNPPPARGKVEPLLRQEAESLKRDGEKVNPSLEVKITWELQSIEVVEQPKNENQPWAGTIRFVITSETPEYDGSTTEERFDKEFNYVWDVPSEGWIMR